MKGEDQNGYISVDH